MRPGSKRSVSGLLPENWEVRQLGDLGTIVRGGSPRPAGDPRYFNGDFVPWLTVGSLTNIPVNKLEVSNTATRLTELGSKHSRKLKAGTLVIVNSGARTLGVTKVLGIDCCANDGIAALLAVQPCDKRFLSYFLNSRIAYLREVVAAGNDQLNLNTSRIGLIEVPFPPLPEQRAIATALGDADALITALDQLIAKKRDLKQAAMQQLLTGKKRLPGFSGAWEVKKLGELLAYEQPTKYLVKSSEYSDANDLPVLTAGKTFILGYTNEINGIYNNLPAIIFDDFTTATKYVSFPFKAKSSAMKILRPRHPAINLRLVFEIMQHVKFPLSDHKRYWISEYQKIEIHLPNAEEQTAIAEVLSNMDAEITALEQRRDKTRAIKQGMMQQLLTGKVRLV